MASGTINGSVTQNSDIFSFYITWSSTAQGASSNSSLVSATAYIKTTDTSKAFNASAIALNINGNTTEIDTKTINFSSNPFIVVSASNISVPHTVTGSKSITISATIGFSSSGSGITPGRCSASGTATLDTINRASTISLSPSSSTSNPIVCNGSNAISVGITRYSTSFTHTVVFAFGGVSTTQTGIGTSASYTPPTTWLQQIPNSLSGRGKVTVTTKSGSTTVGTSTQYFYLKPPAYTPTCTISTITGHNLWNGSGFGSSGVAVQGFSYGSYTVSGSSSYYAKIRDYTSSVGGDIYTTSSVETNTFTSSGNITASGTVTDTRGFTSAVATSENGLDVYAYSLPNISSIQFYRCDENGNASTSGVYVTARVVGSWAVLDNSNSATLSYSLDDGVSSDISVSGGAFDVSTPVLSASSTAPHTIVFSIQDSVGVSVSRGSITKSASVNAVNTLMTFNGNSGIAFGSAILSSGFSVMFDKVGIGAEAPSSSGISVGEDIAPSTAGGASLGSASLPWQNIQTNSINGCSFSGWQNLNTTSAFTAYNQDSAPQYKYNGGLITIRGIVKPTSSFTSSAEGVAITSPIEEAYRPPFDLAFMCQGSGMNRWCLRIKSDGVLYIERYGGTSYATVPETAWLPFCVTFSL